MALKNNEPLHHSMRLRRYRLTASMFGTILYRKPDTPPDNWILQPKYFTPPATEWGKTQESVAMKSYVQYQHSNSHSSLTVTPVGFHISLTHPYLGASPDGAVYDPSTEGEPFGFVEIKCPYTARNMTPVETCSLSSFLYLVTKLRWLCSSTGTTSRR